MNIALPLLLLAFGGLTFWVLTESSLKWYIKTACISVFCIFTIIFWTTIHTFLGWPAEQGDMPEKILVHWVIIKEPNKLAGLEGGIFVLAESAEEIKASKVSKFFGYNKGKIEPRLYELEYSRKLHEQLQKIKSKLGNGQPVFGKITKDGKSGTGEEGEQKKDGDGSESQDQDWEFHELLPSEIHNKPQQ